MAFQHDFSKNSRQQLAERLALCLNVLNHNNSLDSVNDTFITLIPKVKGAHKVGDFRSISLCNFIYKLLSKILPIDLNVSYPPLFLQLNVSLSLVDT